MPDIGFGYTASITQGLQRDDRADCNEHLYCIFQQGADGSGCCPTTTAATANAAATSGPCTRAWSICDNQRSTKATRPERARSNRPGHLAERKGTGNLEEKGYPHPAGTPTSGAAAVTVPAGRGYLFSTFEDKRFPHPAGTLTAAAPVVGVAAGRVYFRSTLGQVLHWRIGGDKSRKHGQDCSTTEVMDLPRLQDERVLVQTPRRWVDPKLQPQVEVPGVLGSTCWVEKRGAALPLAEEWRVQQWHRQHLFQNDRVSCLVESKR